MKNMLLKTKILKMILIIFSLVVLFSVIHPNISSAQTTIKGKVYVYKSTDDSLSVVAHNGIVKFYKLNNQGELVWKATATLNENGEYMVTVNGSADLYALIFPEDLDNSDFVGSYYPGWLDFESADAISTNEAVNGVIDYDWGAVGKEIVERPSNGIANTVSGKITTTTSNTNDLVPMVYLMSGENVVATAPVGIDGRYSISFYGEGSYEVFTSLPGFASQSKYITSENTRGDYNHNNVDFNLDVYRGESETTPVNAVVKGYSLSQNYPNPFNPSTKISFSVPTDGLVKLTVYNSLGKEVTKLVNDLVEAGTYDITFSGQNLSSGIYYYTLQVGNTVITKKMNLVK